MQAQTSQDIVIRALAKGDLDAVVAIDAEIESRSRRGYLERRLEAALREPSLHVQFAAMQGDRLVGYVLARVLIGEFGRANPGFRLEIVGVHRLARRLGVGGKLMQALTDYGRRHDMTDLHTSASWKDHDMLRWFDAMGFVLAPERWLDCPVEGGAFHAVRDETVQAPKGSQWGGEIDYGAPGDNDFEKLARDQADVRSMKPQDLQEIVRIDRAHTGHDRSTYIQSKLADAMSDSSIQVSMTARLDGAIVGYLMARVDIGDFGRTASAAVLDTIGVDPEYENRGIGRALLSQLFVNLGALRVDRVETSLAPRDQALLGFLFDVGFKPAQRLAFTRLL